jgi:chitodextrinase
LIITLKEWGLVSEKPVAPTGLAVSTVTTSSVVLVWEAPASSESSPVESFLIEKQEAGGDFVFAKTVDGKTLSAEVKGLQPGVEYKFRVTAENSAGQSEPNSLDASVSPKSNSMICPFSFVIMQSCVFQLNRQPLVIWSSQK